MSKLLRLFTISFLEGLGKLKQANELEHEFAKAIRIQVMNGFPFDVKAAENLTRDLMSRRAELDVNSVNFPANY